MYNILLEFYRNLRYLFHRYIKSGYFKSCIIDPSFNLTKLSRRKEYYFGYYNVSPENGNENLIYLDLANSKSGKVDIILNKKGIESLIGETESFNLQQGCMLQWGHTNNNLIYYNRFNNNKNQYECVVYDTNSNKIIDILPQPIYSLSKQEDYALTLNFERLAIMRPDYGYFCRKQYRLPDNNKDGIWSIDLKNKKVDLIISLQQLIDLNPVETMSDAMHKVNHIDISPNGSRFMFLHRWVGPQGRFMRLITANRDGSGLCILNGDKMISHCCWYGNDKIISYCYTPEYNEAYVQFTDKSNVRKLVSSSLPKIDGHPSVSNDGKWLVTDQYPEKNRFSKLYLFDILHDKLYIVGSFYQPLKYNRANRIDLHPKWSPNGNRIYFESGHDNYRKLYRVDLPYYDE